MVNIKSKIINNTCHFECKMPPRIALDTNVEIAIDPFLEDVIRFLAEHPDTALHLVGDRGIIQNSKNYPPLEDKIVSIVHAPERLSADEDTRSLVRRFRKHLNQSEDSISKALGLVINGLVDGVVSNGSTRPFIMAATSYRIHPNIRITPAYCNFPTGIPNKKNVAVCDVGANIKPNPLDILVNYLLLGQELANTDIEFPVIALLNIGEEKGKGGFYQLVHSFLERINLVGFYGNEEANKYIFNPRIHGLLCDAWVGNNLLKGSEGIHRMDVGNLMAINKELIEKDLLDPKVAQLQVKKLVEKVDLEGRNGAPILGTQYPLVLGHGSSPPYGALKIGYNYVQREINHEKIFELIEKHKEIKFIG